MPTHTSPPGTLAEIVRTHGATRPGKTALVCDDRRVTWGQLLERSARVAQGLRAHGVGARDRVAFLDRNSIEHFEVLYGAALLNAVSVDVNWRLTPSEVAHVVNDTRASVLVVGQEYVPVVDVIADQLDVSTVLVVGGDPGHASYEGWVARHPSEDPGVTAAPDDVALQLYTSGTTGRPKGVMLTNAGFFSQAPFLADQWAIGPESVVLMPLPLFHLGASGWVTIGMARAAATVVVRDLDPAALAELIPDHQVTHTVLVPSAIQELLSLPGIDTVDFSSLHVVGYGASPISETVLARAVATLGCGFWQGYGLTETGGPVTLLAPSDHVVDDPKARRLRSCGVVTPGFEVRVVDPGSGEDVATGAVGEIWVQGPSLMKGYWNQPEETERSMAPGGWFRTGDAGYLDPDGYLYLHDRIKDMIVSGGENVYPAEVENVLMAHPAVADAAVIGVPHHRWGETPKAIVVLRADATATASELVSFCRSRLAGYKCPTSIDFTRSLPRNPTGKVLKAELRAPFWDGHDRFVS